MRRPAIVATMMPKRAPSTQAYEAKTRAKSCCVLACTAPCTHCRRTRKRGRPKAVRAAFKPSGCAARRAVDAFAVSARRRVTEPLRRQRRHYAEVARHRLVEIVAPVGRGGLGRLLTLVAERARWRSSTPGGRR